ncbi:DUF3368 domain-containing protein [Tundrisphaera lichenicola]|uniref:DUF3368 domain-containing protein n=1 Tax=Tundrisphaera lichenicola TaxID=2029860 RepID=UPI003EBB1740
MIVVISDTSPIRALANLGLLDLLRELYNEVIVPQAVESELRNPRTGQAVVELGSFGFLKIRSPSGNPQSERLLEGLDPGEAEALSIALELRADLVLIDEADARARAKQAGLATVGVLGILIEAKHRGLLGELAPLLDRLRDDYRFFMTTDLRSKILRLAGE